LSKYTKGQQVEVNPNPPDIFLGVRDTDFLLKLLSKSTFEGHEIEQAYSVIKKLGAMHRSNLES
jgi:hypothetical protein